MSRIQTNREAAITTALGPDVLLLQSMHFTEQLGRPYSAELDLYSEQDDAIDFSTIVGSNISVSLDQGDGETRYFNGCVSRFVQASRTGRLARYHATMVPWIWFLTRTSDCRIFQNQTIPDIVQNLLKEKGFTHVESNLHGTHTPKEFCVQYRETDFNFISRLLEREGIFYFFKHDADKHTMVLCDSPITNQPYTGYDQIPYRAVAGDADREFISDWTVEQTVQPGVYSLNDYDFKVPKKSLVTKAKGDAKHPHSDHEIYDYPGEYIQQSDGQDYSKIRVEELQSQHEIVSASSDAMGISAGFTFTLTDPPRDDQDDEHLITSATIQISGDQYDSGGASDGVGGGTLFSAQFTAIKSKNTFRPPRITPKPIVQGPQTAEVVGPKGDEIYTDEHGRVKLQFHWDRYGKKDQNSSCWVRVSQPWAGKGWGSISVPRLGQEVVVDFLEGDPDQPIITGRVYNGDNKAPYPLPGGAVISGVKSNSTKGGGGYNEMIMDDTKGKELIRMHGQFDIDTTIEHDKREHIKNNETINIGVDRTETVGSNETLAVGKNRTRTVGSNESVTVSLTRTHSVGINEAINVGAAQEISIGGLQTISVGAFQAITVGGYQAITVGATQATTVGGSQTNTIGGSQTNTIGSKRSVTVASDQTTSIGGKQGITVAKDTSWDIGTKLAITVADEITITTGSSSISMKKDGTIKISGKDITIEGSSSIKEKAGKISSEADSSNEMKGATITVEASGINTVKGSMVKIN